MLYCSRFILAATQRKGKTVEKKKFNKKENNKIFDKINILYLKKICSHTQVIK